MNRALAREIAMKILYSQCVGGKNSIPDALEQSEKDERLSELDMTFLENIIDGVGAHREVIDEKIMQFAKGWTLERLAKVDLTILRIAVYEMFYEPTIPIGATINEAVELAKNFGDVKSYGYVNGVLASIATTVTK